MASGGTKVVVTAIVANSFVTAAKFIGWAFTGSASMLAEAIHSAADTSNQILLLVGIKQSKKGPSKIFPFGTGKARYVWNLISAMGIFFIGFGVTTYHGVDTLIHPHPKNETQLGFNILMAVLLFALIVEGYAFYVALKESNRQRGHRTWTMFLRKSDDPTTIGVLFEDFVAVLGVLVAFVCILLSRKFGFEAADAVGSIIIGLLMGVMALFLSFINGRLLIGASVNEVKENKIREFLEAQASIEKVEKIKAMTLGAGQILLAIEVEIHGEALVDPQQLKEDCADLAQGDDPTRVLMKSNVRMIRILGREVNRLEKELKMNFPEILSIEIEVN